MNIIDIGVITLLGLLSYKSGALDFKGAIGAMFLGYLILSLGSWVTFFALLTFLIMGTLATRFKAREKLELGNLDTHRSLGNVLGNGLAPLLFLIIEVIIKNDYGWAAVFSSIATANADTLASEIGKPLGKNPRLITNFRKAKPGEEGAVTLVGELAALLGALVIGLIGTFSISDYKLKMLLSVTIAGFIGANIDSLIGATLERRGLVDNNGTNFIATLIGGVLGAVMFLLM
ncbi:hypothetical protein A3L04_01355 [Thermococcus chitonophagus]|uniref:COG1836 n=1 Tax=Thermococcus chitonophagus TaxID=54262 RepID=A0A160VQE1_9EURY|nr:TIGR00297 family protein [Thermococcus chitonophagus]ASJ15813.1 hypothetical protein A3L04_01355 [Thermococcus chitonophagus]CUX77045.1 COG1836 [Thermococcus chitonophagus]